jgi:hypothetical protein
MRDQAGARPPQMQRQAGRFHHHGERCAIMQVERRLMRRRGRDRGHGARPPHLNRPMDMAAHQALDVGVTAHQFRQAHVALAQSRVVERGDAAVERRMVHEEDGRPVAFAEPRFEPVEPFAAELAVRLARHQGIERDQAHRQVFDRVLQKAGWRQVGVLGEGLAQRIARVVVAGDHVERHGKRRQQSPEMGVFLWLAAIHQVAGGEHDVGPRIERIHMRHRPLQEARGIDAAVKQLAFRLDVHVGDLSDEHG